MSKTDLIFIEKIEKFIYNGGIFAFEPITDCDRFPKAPGSNVQRKKLSSLTGHKL
jgi:hypothetical protein